MIKLVYNELYKVFHKKFIYILTGIVLFLFIVVAILGSVFSNTSMDSMIIDMYRPTIETLDLTKDSDAEIYASIKPMIDTYDIAKENNIKPNSAERYYLDMTISEHLTQMYTAKYVEKDEEKYEELKNKVDEEIAELKNFDWKKSIQAKIEDDKILLGIEIPDDSHNKYLKEEIKVLEYRLNNNIPESYSEASQYLTDYLSFYEAYESIEKDESKIIKKDDLFYKRNMEKQVATYSYMIDNNKIKEDYTSNTAYFTFTDMFAGLNIFVIVCILMIAGSIVAEEYSKGTIKQLLVRPFTRTKIILSKTIATFITVLVFMFVVALANGLITGISNGTLMTIFEPNYLYSYTTHSVFETNIIFESFMNLIAILPELIIVTLFTLLISALVGNTALSVVLGFVLTYIPSLFSGLIEKIRALSYLPMYNWDLTQYLYGGIAAEKYASLPKSIIVDCVTIILLIIGVIIAFKKKEIKNQ